MGYIGDLIITYPKPRNIGGLGFSGAQCVGQEPGGSGTLAFRAHPESYGGLFWGEYNIGVV